jgi:hypothetical protein
MGWAEEHMSAVVDRWTKKYHQSGMSAEKFAVYMKKTMLEYGWSEKNASKMVAQVIGKGESQWTMN